MKVLKKGRKQQGWAEEFTCTGLGGCRAKLLVEENDLFLTYSSCMGESETNVTFQCCQCGLLTDVPWKKYPPSWSTLPNQEKWSKRRQRK